MGYTLPRGLMALLKPGNKGMTFLACFFLASGIWVLNALSKNFTSTYTISLASAGHETSEDVLTIQATIAGRGYDLMRLHYRLSGIHPFNDLATQQLSGKMIVENVIGNLKTSIQILNVTPEFITGIKKGLYHKRIPVKCKLEITYQHQTTPSAPVMLKPDSIDISGSLNDINSIEYIETKPSKFLNVSRSLFTSIPLEISTLKNVNVNKEKVWLYIPVEQFTEGMMEIPLTINYKGPSQIKLFPEKVKVTFRVPLRKYNMVKPDQFQAGVFIHSSSNKENINVELLRKPSFVNKVSFSPAEVTYLIFD